MKRFAFLAAALLTAAISRAEEPAYYEQYRQAAVQVSDAVTSSVDQLKAFRGGVTNHELGTSEGLRQQYREKQQAVVEAIAQGQQLFTTATAVLQLSNQELNAAEQFQQYTD